MKYIYKRAKMKKKLILKMMEKEKRKGKKCIQNKNKL